MAIRASGPKRVGADERQTRRKAAAAADPARTIAELRRELAERTAELARRDSELRESNERQTLVVRAVAEGVYDWDIARNALWVSARLIEMFGWQGASLGEGTRPSQQWNERVHPDDFETYRTALRAALKGETAQLGCEYRIRLASGAYRWVEDRAVPVRDERGWAIRLVGAVSDVTLRKEAEQALREAFEQQTATAEVLQVINASPGDLTPVWDAMLDKAMQLCGTAYGFLGIWQDDEHLTLAALRGALRASPALAEYYATNPLWLGPRGGFSRLAQGPGYVQFEDIAASKFYQAGDAYSRALVDLGGARTTLCVPLAKDGKALGVLGFFRQEVNPFSEGEIALVKNFAAQAVIAMENARLLTETREALDQQKASADILRVISTSVADAQPVFEKILDSCKHLFDGDELDVLLVDEEGLLQVAAYHGEGRAAVLATFPAPVDITPAGRAIRERRVAHYPDVQNNPDTPPVLRRMGEIVGYHSIAFAPMIWEDRGIGAIGVARSRGAFTEREMALLQSFADQAVIAINNTRLFDAVQAKTRDLEEALEYQTATSDVLKVISRSTFDLQPVLDTVCKTASRLCNSKTAAIAIREGDVYRYVSMFSVNSEWDTEIRKIRFRPERGSLTGRVALERRVIHIADLASDPEYTLAGTVSIGKFRTMVGVPLLREDEPIGVITLGHEKVQPFSERQIELVRTFADQAVIAIENTRLLTELRESLERQQAMAEVLQVINSSPGDLAPVFEATLDKVMHLCNAAFGVLWTFDGERFEPAALHRVPTAFSDFLRGPLEFHQSGAFAQMVRGADVLQVIEPGTSDLYRSGASPIRRAFVDLGGARVVLFVSLRRDQTLVGVVTVFRQEVRPFSDKQAALLQNFAAQAVIAMDNARLLNEIRQRQAELRVTFDNMGDGVAMFDADLRLAAWNTNFQKILDLPDDLVARRPTLTEYFDYMAARGEYGSAEREAELRRSLQAGELEARYERTRPDGRVIEVRRNAVPGGGVVLIYGDITERKRAEAEIRAARDAAETALTELRQTQQQLVVQQKMAALGQLTAGIAHEIKNPLNFVNNFAGLSHELLDELKEIAAPGFAGLEADARAEIDDTIALLTGNLDKIAEHGRRADNIVKSMLAHSRGSSGERQAVDLNALVDEALNLAYHGARAQDQGFNITMERAFGEGIAPVELVPQDITRVFLNLIGNGFYAADKRAKAAGDGFRPVLRVATRAAGEAVEIRVRDNGIGIAPEHRERLFQPFFTTKPTGEGTGLGLSISFDIVTQQHGGTIEVASEPGQFTEFTIRLPRRAPQTTAQGAA